MEHSSGPKRLKVLLADDAIVCRETLSGILASKQFDVHAVTNGLEAIAAYTTDTFDAILLDLKMPEIDGQTVAKLIRNQGFAGPIIAITASQMENRLQLIEQGFTDLCNKPIFGYHLIKTLEKHLTHLGRY